MKRIFYMNEAADERDDQIRVLTRIIHALERSKGEPSGARQWTFALEWPFDFAQDMAAN